MSNLSAGMMYAERLDSTTKRFVDTEASIAQISSWWQICSTPHLNGPSVYREPIAGR